MWSTNIKYLLHFKQKHSAIIKRVFSPTFEVLAVQTSRYIDMHEPEPMSTLSAWIWMLLFSCFFSLLSKAAVDAYGNLPDECPAVLPLHDHLILGDISAFIFAHSPSELWDIFLPFISAHCCWTVGDISASFCNWDLFWTIQLALMNLLPRANILNNYGTNSKTS